jgi:hypothetical protein
VTPAKLRALERSPTGRLAISLRPGDPLGGRFLILTAYYDESGTHAGSPITILAGFIGSVGDWVEFEREWRKVLRKHGVSHVRAKHLFHRQGQHKNWSEDRVWGLEADLLYVLQEHKNIFATKTMLHENTRGSVNFVLESGHKNAGDALRVFNEIKASKTFSWRDAIGSLTFGTKQDFPALQAADMLAYWFYKAACDMFQPAGDGRYWHNFVEKELVDSGLSVLYHLIDQTTAWNLRQNFRRKSKKPVFGRAILESGVIIDPKSRYTTTRS